MLNAATQKSAFQLLGEMNILQDLLPLSHPPQCLVQSLSFRVQKHTQPVKWPAAAGRRSSFAMFMHFLPFQQMPSEFQSKINTQECLTPQERGSLLNRAPTLLRSSGSCTACASLTLAGSPAREPPAQYSSAWISYHLLKQDWAHKNSSNARLFIDFEFQGCLMSL